MLEQFAGRLAVRSFVAWLSLLVPTVLGAAEARFRVQVGSSDVDSAVVRPLRAVIAVPESLSSVTWAAWTDAADRLVGFGRGQLVLRNASAYAALELEGGFRPAGYGQITLALGMRTLLW